VDQSKVTRVRGEVLFVRSGIANRSDDTVGYRYIADREESSSQILLSETRLRYEWAYQWAESVPSRGHMVALASRFTFGSSSGAQSNLGALAEFHIKWEHDSLAAPASSGRWIAISRSSEKRRTKAWRKKSEGTESFHRFADEDVPV
jgi:hypothetical protein